MRMAEDLRHDKPEKTEAYKDEDDEKTISIKVSVLRNIAAACIAAIAFFLFPSPTSTIQQPIAGNSLNTSLLLRIMPKDIITGQPVPVAVEKNKDATATPDCEVKEEKEEVKEPETKYTIVLASRVSTNNAEYFTGQLHKKGFDKARIITHKKNTHVVFGAYSTEAEAYNALRPLRQTESDLAEAWVMKVQE